nr:AlNc14C303G10414 [Albugo laibachii Nc14]|eukprot:CCA25523.1 AlNc14C303G10414 [Albugo laibachii Nc14]
MKSLLLQLYLNLRIYCSPVNTHLSNCKDEFTKSITSSFEGWRFRWCSVNAEYKAKLTSRNSRSGMIRKVWYRDFFIDRNFGSIQCDGIHAESTECSEYHCQRRIVQGYQLEE